MNKLMIAQIAYNKQGEDNSFKRVKEQYLIPGDTYSTAEDFVFTELVKSMKGEVILDRLKREAVEDIFVQDDNFEEGWYKCKVSMQDAESEKEKFITMYYYVNANSVSEATNLLERNLIVSISDFEVKSTVLSPIVDVYAN